MTIGIIQPNIISDEIEKNLQHCEELMKSLMGVANAHSCVQIFLLPEMFATGFPATKEQAEPPLLADGDNQYAKIQLWMKCVARELNAVVAGSVAVRENEVAAETTTVAGTIATTVAEEETIVAVEEATTAVAEETTTEAKATEETAITGTTSTIAAEANKAIYNRLIWMRPTGEYFTYDKKHLFGAEKEAYQQGDQIITIQEQGWNFRLNICYDLRFPVWCKNRRLYGNTLDYDVIIFPSSWPTPRINIWKTLLPARAAENLAYSIGINRSGKDINGTRYSGQSIVSDPQGNIIAQLDEKPQAITVTLNKERLERLRMHLTVAQDWDEYQLKQ